MEVKCKLLFGVSGYNILLELRNKMFLIICPILDVPTVRVSFKVLQEMEQTYIVHNVTVVSGHSDHRSSRL
jgi:hypothetical protein